MANLKSGTLKRKYNNHSENELARSSEKWLVRTAEKKRERRKSGTDVEREKPDKAAGYTATDPASAGLSASPAGERDGRVPSASPSGASASSKRSP